MTILLCHDKKKRIWSIVCVHRTYLFLIPRPTNILEIIFDRKLVFTFPCIPHIFILCITYFLQTTTVFYSLLLQGIKSQVKRAYDTKIHMVQRFGK